MLCQIFICLFIMHLCPGFISNQAAGQRSILRFILYKLLDLFCLWIFQRRVVFSKVECDPSVQQCQLLLSCVFVTQGYGRRSRTTSESSAHSVGRERSNSAAKQPSPPPSAPAGKDTKKETKKEAAPRKVNFLSKVPTAGGDLLVNVITPGSLCLRSPD